MHRYVKCTWRGYLYTLQYVPKVISLLCSCWSSTQCRSSSAGIYIQSCVTVPDGPELTDSFKTWDHDAGSTLTLLFLCFILLPVLQENTLPVVSVYKATVAFVLYSVFQALSSTHNTLHSPENLFSCLVNANIRSVYYTAADRDSLLSKWLDVVVGVRQKLVICWDCST